MALGYGLSEIIGIDMINPIAKSQESKVISFLLFLLCLKRHLTQWHRAIMAFGYGLLSSEK